MGIGSDGDTTSSKMETYVTFAGAGETDGGLSFGLSSTIATYSVSDAQAGDGFSNDGTSVFISGAFGKLTMGSVDEADKVAALSDIGGINGLGVDNVAEAYVGAGGHEVNYTYSADAITASISGDVSGDNYAVGGKYTMGDYYAALGYNKEGNDKVTSVYAGGTFGAVKVAAMYSQDDNDESAVGIHAAYTTGATTLAFEYADSDNEAEAAYGVGASYDLGGGASATGGVASVDGTTVWEAGVAMSF